MSLKHYCHYLEEAISQFNSEYPFSLALRSGSKNLGAFTKLFFTQQGFDVVCLHNVIYNSESVSYDWKTSSEKEVQGMINPLSSILQNLDNPLVIFDNYQVIYGDYDEGVRALLGKGLIAKTQSVYQPYEAQVHAELHSYAPVIITGNSMFYDNVKSHTYDKTFTQIDYSSLDNNVAVLKMAQQEQENMYASDEAYHSFVNTHAEALDKNNISTHESRRLIRLFELHKYQLKQDDYQLNLSMFQKTGFGLKA
jgi:hypothetical protein